MDYGYCLDDASFSKLYNKVKKASFDDNKFDLIEVASLGCYYSCAQVVRIMKIFSFYDSKIKVLSMMAPRIVDLQNAIIIYQQFNFESEKQKVGEILRSSRISPQNLHIQWQGARRRRLRHYGRPGAVYQRSGQPEIYRGRHQLSALHRCFQ